MKSNRIKDATRGAAKGVAERATEQMQSVELRERLAPVVEHAVQVAREQATQAAAAAEHARSWAAPRVEAAVERSLQAAAPKVEAAADRVGPAVDAARDRIVDDLLPWLVEAVHSAAAAGSAAKAAATDTVSHKVEDAARSLADGTPTGKARRRRGKVRLVLFGAVFAALAAGAVAWRRSRGNDGGWEAAPTEPAVASRADATGARPGPERPGIPGVSGSGHWRATASSAATTAPGAKAGSGQPAGADARVVDLDAATAVDPEKAVDTGLTVPAADADPAADTVEAVDAEPITEGDAASDSGQRRG